MVSRSGLALLAVAAVAAVSVSAQLPLCQLPGNYMAYSDAVACIRSIPFDPAIRANTIDSLQKSISVFAFQWPSKNIPPTAEGLTIAPVDLAAGLQTILGNSYTTDIDFQNDLVALYNGLCDAHSLYFRPTAYSVFTFWQSFSLVSIGGGTEIFIAPYFPAGLEAAYQQYTGLNITQYAGARVTQIEGQDATAYITAYAKANVGLSKDLATRYNVALTRFEPTITHLGMASGSWQKRRGLYFTMPLDKPDITYSLVMPDGTTTTVDVPWIAQSSVQINGTSSLLGLYYANGAGPADATVKVTPPPRELDGSFDEALSTPATRKPHVTRDVTFPKSEMEYFERPAETAGGPAASGFTLILSHEDMTFWAHPDNITLVMYLSTFEPDNVQQYMAALVQGITTGQGMGLTRFMMDFTDNGGGDICFGIAVLDYLFGSAGDLGTSPTDMPYNAFTADLATRAATQGHNDTIWSAFSYQSYETAYAWPNANITWMIPPVTLQRYPAPATQTFSQLLDLSNAACAGYNVAPLAKPFPSDQMLIISRGFCGSTCALVSGHAHLFHEVPAVTLGGLQTQAQQQIFSFPGLQVVDSPDFYAMWSELGYNVSYSAGGAPPNELCPRLLGTTAGFRYCIREIYPPYEVISGWTSPLEYVFTPSDFHLYFNAQSVLHSETAWLQATQFFPPSKPAAATA